MSNMRGWLMMVATLFVGIAFQSVLQRPPTMSSEDSSPKGISGAASPAPAPATTADKGEGLRDWSTYNAFTMFMSLGLLVVLMTMKRSNSTTTLRIVRAVLVLISFIVGSSFIIATTGDLIAQLIYVIGLGIIILIGIFLSFEL
jgi:CHASE2 domain-containing sensor protein